ncbi:MAG: hypothetical protein K2K28_03565 [Clostridia bacterium]|nr:hypothetical protein [Clostridia bacterium]MDE6613613.1 hypothetical protein [Clostridia bacterium]
MEEEIKTALKKCAVGFGTSEVVEEFSVEDGELKLIKKKVTRRDVPPDIKAVKLLMDGGTEQLSDEELEAEMQRLTKLLEEENFE